MTFLYNAWYPAGWGHEVGPHFLARRFLDIPVMLFRDSTGSIVALNDMCPHRFAPLSMGQLVNDRVRCGYHGLEFDTTGQCVGSCLNMAAPKAAKVRAFPIIERDNIVWIWMGEDTPEHDPNLRPAPFHSDPKGRTIFGHTLARSHYQLLSDNLMDLMHIHLLHPAFGGIDFPSDLTAREEEGDIICHYHSDYPQAPSIEENIIRWSVPSNHYLDTMSTPKGGQTDYLPSCHLLTPETETSTHYFWSSGTPTGMSVEDGRAFLTQVFDHEDKPMVEAVQSRMRQREFWAMKPLLLQTDAGAVRVRRKMDALIAQEQAAREKTLAPA